MDQVAQLASMCWFPGFRVCELNAWSKACGWESERAEAGESGEKIWRRLGVILSRKVRGNYVVRSFF